MAYRRIKHRRTETVEASDGKKSCEVELVDTDYFVHAKKRDTLQFIRERPDQRHGFEVSFEPQLGAQKTYGTNNPTLDIEIPNNPLPAYKYTIYYPNDLCCKVTPLDPIIIINPDFFSRLKAAFIFLIITFGIGAFVGMRFF